MRVYVDAFPVSSRRIKQLMPDGEVSKRAQVLVPPMPSVAVQFVVGELVHSFDVFKEHDAHGVCAC